jgi:hypothetical protein
VPFPANPAAVFFFRHAAWDERFWALPGKTANNISLRIPAGPRARNIMYNFQIVQKTRIKEMFI